MGEYNSKLDMCKPPFIRLDHDGDICSFGTRPEQGHLVKFFWHAMQQAFCAKCAIRSMGLAKECRKPTSSNLFIAIAQSNIRRAFPELVFVLS